jgi:hypothetical protein
MIAHLNEVPGMTDDDRKLLDELNAEIVAFNAEEGRLESERQRLKDTPAAEFTPADVEAGERMRTTLFAMVSKEIAVRSRLGNWERRRRSALSRVLDEAERARDAFERDLVKKMVAMGFAPEIPVPAFGVTIPGIMGEQIVKHPRMIELNDTVLALTNQRDERSWFHQNNKVIEGLQKKLDAVKARAAVTV